MRTRLRRGAARPEKRAAAATDVQKRPPIEIFSLEHDAKRIDGLRDPRLIELAQEFGPVLSEFKPAAFGHFRSVIGFHEACRSIHD